MKEKLIDIVDALEMQMDESRHYLNKNTGEISFITDEDLEIAERNDEEEILDLPDWQKDNVDEAAKILDSEDYLVLPNKQEIRDYDIMRDFALFTNSDQLMNAIQGSGAFRYFKDMIHQLGWKDQWFEFKANAYLEKARKWCEDQGINYD